MIAWVRRVWFPHKHFSSSWWRALDQRSYRNQFEGSVIKFPIDTMRQSAAQEPNREAARIRSPR